jgi:hypothetical protein
MYHGYVTKVIGHMTFWHYNGSFGLFSNHLPIFLGGLGLSSMVQLLHAPFWDVGF